MFSSEKIQAIQFIFSNPSLRDEFQRIVEDLVKNAHQIASPNGDDSNLGIPYKLTINSLKEIENQLRLDKMGKDLFEEQQDIPSKEEWNTILKNGRCLQFKKGDSIIKEGERHHRFLKPLLGND